MNIIIFGPPLSGKGTHTKFLRENHGYDVISTGALLRQHVAEKTELGKKIEPIMNAGDLIPTEDVLDVVKNAYLQRSSKEGVLFDGTPRRVNEFHDLQAFLKSQGETFHQILFLNVPENELLHRMETRRQATIDVGETPRADDNEDVLKHRLEKYYSESLPVVAAASQYNIEVKTVNGNQDIALVQQEILHAIHNYDPNPIVGYTM